MDKIFIKNFPIDTIIGLHSHELNTKQKIILDLELQIDSKKAARHDEIKDTVDYSILVEAIQSLCDTKRFKLIESLAEYLCSYILENFNTTCVTLAITKPNALTLTNTVGVVITRSK